MIMLTLREFFHTRVVYSKKRNALISPDSTVQCRTCEWRGNRNGGGSTLRTQTVKGKTWALLLLVIWWPARCLAFLHVRFLTGRTAVTVSGELSVCAHTGCTRLCLAHRTHTVDCLCCLTSRTTLLCAGSLTHPHRLV